MAQSSLRRPAAETRPASFMGARSRRVFALGGTLALIGVVLSVVVPLFGLRSAGCGVVDCGLMQVIGKALAAGGLGLAMATAAVASLRAGQFSAAALAALVAGPALLWSVLIVDGWRNLQAGTDEATGVLAAARDYTAAQRGFAPADLRPIIVNGKGEWISVRVAEPAGRTELVILQRQGSGWTPRAIAPAFTRDQLRALGAPTDVVKDEG